MRYTRIGLVMALAGCTSAGGSGSSSTGAGGGSTTSTSGSTTGSGGSTSTTGSGGATSTTGGGGGSTSATVGSGGAGGGTSSSSAGGAGGGATTTATSGSGGAGGASGGLWNAHWSRFSQAAAQSSLGASAAFDAAGNVIFWGHFLGDIDFGAGILTSAGQDDVFLVKLDPMGNVLWQKRYGNAGSQQADQLFVDAAGNIVVLGLFNGTIDFGGDMLLGPGNAAAKAIYIAKLDPTGNRLWSKSFGLSAGPTTLYSMAGDSAGNVVFTGDYSSLIDFGGGALVGPGHVYLAKLDAAGNHVFSKSYNASYARVASTPAGDLALLGSSTLTPPDLGGGPLPLVAVGSRDIFFARLSPAGTFMWAKAIGSVDNDWAGVVAFDGAQNIVFSAVSVTGIDYGGGVLADAHLVKMSPTGQYMWGKAVPGASFTHMETDTGDAIYVSASAIGPVDFGGGPLLPAGNPDVVLVKLDAGGQQLHALRAGNDWGQTPLWISPHGGQGAAVAGFFGGTMDLGAGPMSCNGNSCAFVASFPP